VLGWDMTAALAMGSALGITPRAVVELLPGIEAAMIRKLNEEIERMTDG
jgi:glycerol-3-phosphate responsive antiterminator